MLKLNVKEKFDRCLFAYSEVWEIRTPHIWLIFSGFHMEVSHVLMHVATG